MKIKPPTLQTAVQQPTNRPSYRTAEVYTARCPKCITGSLNPGYDQYGKFVTCLNCGWQKDLPNTLD